MTSDNFREFKIDDSEYFINLTDVNKGDSRFLVKINNFLFYFVNDSDIEDRFRCFELIDDQNIEIEDNIFIINHVINFIKILDNKNFSALQIHETIEYNNDKLIIINKNLMYFFDNQTEILYQVEDYKINSVKLIYNKNAENKIDYHKSSKKLLNLIKSNYDLLELSLMKFEIKNLSYEVQKHIDDEHIEELIIELEKIKEDYNVKLLSALDSRNFNYEKGEAKINNRYFSVIFNDSWCFNLAKTIINFIEVEFYLYKFSPTLYFLFITKLLNALLLPIADLLLGFTEFFSYNFFHEKKIEIDEQREKLAEIVHNYQAFTQQQKIIRGGPFAIFSIIIDFICTYSFELIHFFIMEIFNIFNRLNFSIKKYLTFA